MDVETGSFTVQLWGDTSGPAETTRRSPVVLLLHGIPMSSDSWAACAEHFLEFFRHDSKSGVVLCAPDLRGHGSTAARQDEGLGLSQVVQDTELIFRAVLQSVLQVDPESTKIYVVGHSFGGAVAAALCSKPSVRSQVAGLVLLDIVEETALASLRHMNAFLDRRPAQFPDVASAAKWYVTDGGMRNIDAARRSVGRTLVKQEDGTFGWRTDLKATEPYWAEWYKGLNQNFLSVPCPKVLVLAGVDRLDKAMTLAQMQGKFQFEVVRESGHHVQEDQPQVVAQVLARFVARVDKLTRALPPVAAPRELHQAS